MEGWASHVHPHGPLVRIGPRLWTVAGKLPRGNMPRNMVVHVLASGGLLIHSAVALDEKTMTELLALGEPEVMIVPCAIHRLDAAVWKARFPRLKVIAPAVARAAAAKVVAVDGTCEENLRALGVKWHAPAGLKPFELWYEVDSGAGRALILTDSLMNISNQPGFGGLLMKTIGSTGFFGLTFIGRILLLKDRKAYRAWLESMARTPELKAILLGHGDPILSDVPGRLLAAAARL